MLCINCASCAAWGVPRPVARFGPSLRSSGPPASRLGRQEHHSVGAGHQRHALHPRVAGGRAPAKTAGAGSAGAEHGGLGIGERNIRLDWSFGCVPRGAEALYSKMKTPQIFG